MTETTVIGRIRRRSTALSVAVLALVAYVPTLMSSPGRMPADTKLYLYLDPERLTTDAPWTFDGRQFAGWVPHQQITYLWPSGPWYWFWETVGAPDWVAHRLWLGTLFFVAGLGVRWLARTFGIGVPGALVAALVYELSPYVLPYVSRTSLMLLPWAGLGWIVGLTVRAAIRGGWKYPAILALVIATVGSPNATALAMIAPAPVWWLAHAVWQRTITWRQAVATALRIGLMAIGVSMWWITMLSVQGKRGADVLAYSESLEAVSFTSTSSEVLRSLGYWLFYIRDAYAPTTSSSWDYMASTRLIAVGYLLLLVCFVGLVVTRWSQRRFALGLFAGGVILAVGVHPLGDPSPLTDWLINDTESGLALALRSSTRALPMASLGLALGAAALVSAVRPARNWLRALVPVGVVALVALNMPSLWRHDYIDPALDRDEDPPQAWLDASAELDAMPAGYRVFQVPGQEFGAYRWGYTVDQPLPGLTERPLITRDLLPLGSPQAMDLLYALDDRFQDGVLEPETIAPIARLFGADVLWLTNDATYERFRTPRPELMTDLFESQPEGLGRPRPYGEPFVSNPDISMVDEQSVTSPLVGQAVPPVMLVPVNDPQPIVRAKSDVAIVSGNGDGVVDAAAVGLLDGSELVRYSADIPSDKLASAMRRAGLVIVTDTNRDRARRWNSSQDNVGFTETGGQSDDLLRPESADARLPAFENVDPATQTTAHQVGPVTAVASAYGEPFAYRPEDRAAMAIDGDPSTAWRVADRFAAAGEQIRLESGEGIDHLTVTQAPHAERQRHITAVDVSIDGGEPQRFELDESSFAGGQRLDIDPTDGPTTVTITIAETRSPVKVPGPALAAVGFAEIDLGLGATTEVVRPPSDLVEQLAELPSTVDAALVFTRLRYDPTDRFRSDPEPSLIRELTLPDGVDLDVTPTVTAHLDRRASDAVLAELFEDDQATSVAVSSDRAAGVPAAGGWAAVDGDPETAWVTPFAYPQGSTLEIPISDELESFTITQPTGDYSTITSLRVTIGDESFVVDVPQPDEDGTSEVTLPRALRPSAPTIEITVDQIEDEPPIIDRRYAEPIFPPAAISEISIGSPAPLPEELDTGCRRDLLTIDGDPVGLRLTGSTSALFDGEPFEVERCGGSEGTLSFDEGRHQLRSEPGAATGIDIDRVTLRGDTEADEADEPAGGPESDESPRLPRTTIVSGNRTATTVDVEPCPTGCWLVFGEGYNDGWEASTSKHDLGRPKPVDGGFNGWWIEPTKKPTRITVAWTGQEPVTIGFLISGVTAVAAAAILVVALATRRRIPARSDSVPHDEAPTPALGAQPRFDVVGRPVTIARAVLAAVVGTVAAALLIGPLTAVWVAAVGIAVVVTRRPRIAGFAALATGIYIGGAVVETVRRDRPYPNGAWLEHIEWLHPYGMAVVVLAIMTGIGAYDAAPRRG